MRRVSRAHRPHDVLLLASAGESCVGGSSYQLSYSCIACYESSRS